MSRGASRKLGALLLAGLTVASMCFGNLAHELIVHRGAAHSGCCGHGAIRTCDHQRANQGGCCGHRHAELPTAQKPAAQNLADTHLADKKSDSNEPAPLAPGHDPARCAVCYFGHLSQLHVFVPQLPPAESSILGLLPTWTPFRPISTIALVPIRGPPAVIA